MNMTADDVLARAGAPADLSGALRTYVNIARVWDLKDAEAATLLGTPLSTYARWKANPTSANLTHAIQERMSYVFGIFKALRLLYANDEHGYGWLRRHNLNPLFKNRTPLDLMLAGNISDLYLTRRYLDTWRNAW